MKVVTLADVAEVKLGRQRSPKNHTGENMRPYLRSANVDWSGLSLDDVKTMNFTENEMQIYRLEPGDLLLNEGSGSPAEVGKAALWSGEIAECAFQYTLLRVRPGAQVCGRFLLHYFRWQAVSGAFARGSRGVGIYHLGKHALAQWPIPLATPSNQSRIVEVLDCADRVLTNLRLLRANLRELLANSFAETFTGEHFSSSPLGAHTAGQQIGLDRRAAEQGPSGRFDYVKMDAITNYGDLDLTKLTRVDASELEAAKYSLADGDLIFNTRNSRELVGKSAIYHGRPRLYNNNIVRIRFHETLLPGYVHRFLWSPDGRRQLERRKAGTTSVFAIYGNSISDIEIPVPPLELQRNFVARAEAIEAQLKITGAAVTEGEELVESLQARAFAGEL